MLHEMREQLVEATLVYKTPKEVVLSDISQVFMRDDLMELVLECSTATPVKDAKQIEYKGAEIILKEPISIPISSIKTIKGITKIRFILGKREPNPNYPKVSYSLAIYAFANDGTIYNVAKYGRLHYTIMCMLENPLDI